jgi:hypothetical protein
MHSKGTIRADQGRLAEADRLYGDAVRGLNALLAKFISAYARAL